MAESTLYHVSSDGAIQRFDPRPPPSPDAGVDYDAVWAIDAKRLVNYLLPRDCPRVTYYPTGNSAQEDIDRLIGPSLSQHVVAIEAGWLERATTETIWIYEFDSADFHVVDSGAGYFVSINSIYPTLKRRVQNPLLELVAKGAELRVVASLWPLRDQVLASTLQFSFIRMRNAKPRDEGH